jgi:hypothetical protein
MAAMMPVIPPPMMTTSVSTEWVSEGNVISSPDVPSQIDVVKFCPPSKRFCSKYSAKGGGNNFGERVFAHKRRGLEGVPVI